MATKDTRSRSPQTPRTIIYQNSDFVSAMLQELHRKGLLKYTESDSESRSNRSTSKSTQGTAGANAGASVPGAGKAGLDINGERIRKQSEADERSNADKQKFVYSQAFYLDEVRRELFARKQVLTKPLDATVGDIVEFPAVSVRPNEVNALLDVATPELVGEIARYMVRAQHRDQMQTIIDRADDAEVTVNTSKIAAQKAMRELEASDKAELASAVAEALRVDSRRTATREYHAQIDAERNAIIMCDADHFICADPDRILDGQFTVLGKVIKPVTDQTPIFNNNKVLRRFHPDAVNTLLEPLRNDEVAGKYFDLAFEHEVRNAITVLPIAIFA